MSYDLNYTIQVMGTHTYSSAYGEEILLIRSDKRHLVISDEGENCDEPPIHDSDDAIDQDSMCQS